MAFNPAMVEAPPKAEDKALIPVSARQLALLTAPRPKKKYYMEFWRLGDPATAIQVGEFETANIKHVVRKVIGGGRYNVVFLMRLHDQKILWDRRTR
jgi:hypothetical protein